jgi:hypothetical protein
MFDMVPTFMVILPPPSSKGKKQYVWTEGFSETFILGCWNVARHVQVDSYLITDHLRIVTFGNEVLTQDD